MVSGFDPDQGVWELLGRMDVFRVQRVVFGDQDLSDEVERGGVAGLLQHRRVVPPAPSGHGAAPPVTPKLRDRFFRKAQWNDEEVVAARDLAEPVVRVADASGVGRLAGTAHAQQWRRPLEQVQRELSALTRALTEFARQDVEDFPRRSAELYRKRVGVSYLLPAGTGRMEQFYQQVYRRLLEHKARDGLISINSDEADLVKALVGADAWPEAFKKSVEQTPEHAVSYLRERVKTEIKKFLREPPPGEQPMLPRLQDLLAEAAGHRTRAWRHAGLPGGVPGQARRAAARQLHARRAAARVKVLVNYPADAPSNVIEGYLKSSINLPAGPRITEDYRDTRTESISVVLFRTAMGVTEVDEVRDVLRRWAGALARPEPTDLLRWRQRTGYDFGYLATRRGAPGRDTAPAAMRAVERPGHDPGAAGITRAAQRRARRRRDDDAAAHPARPGVLLGQPAARLRAVGAGRRRPAPPVLRAAHAGAAGGPRRPAIAAERAVPGAQGSRRGAGRAPRRPDERASARRALPVRADARVLGDYPARRARPVVHRAGITRGPEPARPGNGRRHRRQRMRFLVLTR